MSTFYTVRHNEFILALTEKGVISILSQNGKYLTVDKKELTHEVEIIPLWSSKVNLKIFLKNNPEISSTHTIQDFESKYVLENLFPDLNNSGYWVTLNPRKIDDISRLTSYKPLVLKEEYILTLPSNHEERIKLEKERYGAPLNKSN